MHLQAQRPDDRPFRVDLHCHSTASSVPSNWLMQAFKVPECPTPPRRVYELARARGMSAVTLTDHDTVEGALQLAHLPDFIVGEEVTSRFPEDGCTLHVVVLGITPRQHEELQRVRHDLYELVAWLHEHHVAHYLAHPLSDLDGRLSSWHVERLMLLFDTWSASDAVSPRRLLLATRWLADWRAQPGVLERLAERHRLPLPRRTRPVLVGGSDDHSGLTVGLCYTEARGVQDVASFLDALRAGDVREGGEADDFSLAQAVYSIGYQVLKERGLLPEPAARTAAVLDGFLQPGPPRAPLVSTLLSRISACSIHRQARRASPPGRRGRSCSEAERWVHLVELWFSRSVARAVRQLMRNGVEGALRRPHALTAVLTAHGIMLPLWLAMAKQSRMERRGLDIALGIWAQGNGQGEKPPPPVREAISPEPRVAYFTDTFDELNGVSLTAQRMARWAHEVGAEVTVMAPDARDFPGSINTLVRLRSLASFALAHYPDLKLHVPSMSQVLGEAARFDVLHAATPGPVGLAALAAARLLHRPFTAAYHTHLPEYVEHLTGSRDLAGLTWKAVRWFYGQADRILVPSEAVADHLLRHGVDRETGGRRLVVFRRGVDIESFHPRHRRTGFWARFGIAPDRPVVLYVGRISREKNLEALGELLQRLEASDRLRRAGLRPAMALIGGGPLLPELKQRFPGLVLTGPLAGDDLAFAYASADVFVFPSLTDTFGNVVLEAMASGLVCVVADRGGPREQVQHGVSGFVVDSQRWAEQAAFAIERLLTDPALLVRMRHAARAAVEKRPAEFGLAELRQRIAEAARIPVVNAMGPAAVARQAVAPSAARGRLEYEVAPVLASGR